MDLLAVLDWENEVIRWPWTKAEVEAVRPDMTRRRFLKALAAVPVAAVVAPELVDMLKPRKVYSFAGIDLADRYLTSNTAWFLKDGYTGQLLPRAVFRNGMTARQFHETLRPGLNNAFSEAYNKYEPQWKQLYGSDLITHNGFGAAPLKYEGQPVLYDQDLSERSLEALAQQMLDNPNDINPLSPWFRVQHDPGRGIIYTRIHEQDLFTHIVQRRHQALVDSLAQTQREFERRAADIWNDGVALTSAAHPRAAAIESLKGYTIREEALMDCQYEESPAMRRRRLAVLERAKRSFAAFEDKVAAVQRGAVDQVNDIANQVAQPVLEAVRTVASPLQDVCDVLNGVARTLRSRV